MMNKSSTKFENLITNITLISLSDMLYRLCFFGGMVKVFFSKYQFRLIFFLHFIFGEDLF